MLKSIASRIRDWLLGPPPRCRSAIVDIDFAVGRLGVVRAACEMRDGHRGKHAGPDVEGRKVEW